MGEKKTTSFWRFAESPFTWGGIGVFIGVALASPTWFKYGFIGSIVSIGVGAFKAGFFEGRGLLVRLFGTLALCACLAGGGWELWGVVPKPREPVTKQDINDAVREALASNPQSAPTFPVQPDVNKGNVTTKAEIVQAVRDALLQFNRDKAAGAPADRSASQYGQLNDDQLIAAAKVVAEQMNNFQGEWKYKVEEVGARYQNEREQSPTPSPERMTQLWEEEPKERESVNQQYTLKSKDLFARADDLRGVCAARLKKKGSQLPTDGNIADVFKRLATAGIDSPYGSNSDPDRTSKYLLDLCKRLGHS